MKNKITYTHEQLIKLLPMAGNTLKRTGDQITVMIYNRQFTVTRIGTAKLIAIED